MDVVMTLLVWAILGFGIGAAAKYLVPGTDHGGFVWAALLGIFGALLGGSIASAFGFGAFTGFHMGGLFIAMLGAMFLLGTYRYFHRAT